MKKGVELQDPVVLITSRDPENQNFGTGFVMYRRHDSLYVLTCAHVVEFVGGASQVQIQDVPAELVESGAAQGPDDLAVLRVAGILREAAPLTLDDAADVGQRVLIKGFYKFHQKIRKLLDSTIIEGLPIMSQASISNPLRIMIKP